MNKFFTFLKYSIFAIVLGFSVASCDDDNNNEIDDEKEQMLSDILTQYVNNTVVVTYRGMADASIDLYDALVALRDDKTNANVQAACDAWLESRDYWEKSEAFLYGAAADFGIDPHIDTWPLAKDELLTMLKNDAQIASMDSEDGPVWAGEYLGNGLLGFHGIEYIIFEAGSSKNASNITERELIYAIAVSGDLRNQCIRLETAWAGIDNVTSEKRELMEELEYVITIGKRSYGEDMLNAGSAGSTYVSVLDACETIIEGCSTISDEVAGMKIGKPYTGDDINYIESPYSYNSKVDFIGNIISIQNAYLGGADANNRKASVSDYIKQVDSDLDTRVKDAMTNAIAKIEAIPYPFAKYFTSDEAGAAMEACNDLTDVLDEAKKALSK